MWNAMQSKSLVGAVLITATIQGALLWRINNMATEGASALAQESVNSLLTTPTEVSPETRYITLEPVVIVGRRDTLLAEHATELVSALAPVAQNADHPGRKIDGYIW